MATIGAHTYLKTHTLQGKMLQFQLREEQDALLEKARSASTGRTAKTLVKEGPLRMTLIAMRKGARMRKHHVEGQTSVHVLRGRMLVASEAGPADLGAGGVVVFDDSVEHDVIAQSDCVFLVTMSWHGRS